jgi:hypothetical protein
MRSVDDDGLDAGRGGAKEFFSAPRRRLPVALLSATLG